MQFDILTLIIIFSVLFIFATMLAPHFINKKYNKYDQASFPIEQNNTVKEITDNSTKYREKYLNLIGKLNSIRVIFDEYRDNRHTKLFSTIDNIVDYIGRLGDHEIYLIEYLEHSIDGISTNYTEENVIEKMNQINIKLLPIQELLSYYFSSAKLYKENIQPFYRSALGEISNELKKFRKLKNILANSSTTEIYQLEKNQHNISYRIYLGSFFATILLVFFFTYISLEFKDAIVGANNKNIIDYWILKASGVFIFITLISFFLKQAIHHQKKRDQVEKIMLELKALPAYMADLDPQDAINLRKDLASKYFGNTTDHSTINDLSNIVNEQLKTSIELIKVFNVQKGTDKTKDKE
ncbi:hypothetical protein [Acinetobacter sp. ANC 4173]|uniref:hypothetical protein n=1 Tax=Acinetobacter sp. ANC 4173 TaxID=2529837 RepID=UPI00103AA86D|nr:hypothetical protein [Acinetobacter sp. ANC 4173]TCB81632.1 hypothetical protein E0H94_03695 [Acinetobacter sp. ANC 4173]